MWSLMLKKDKLAECQNEFEKWLLAALEHHRQQLGIRRASIRESQQSTGTLYRPLSAETGHYSIRGQNAE